MTDHRMNLDLITDMFGLLDQHGYTRGDKEHTGRAILLLGDLARIYEGSQDHPFGPYIGEIPPRPEPVPPEPVSHDAITVPASQVKTLDIRPDHRRRLQTRPRRAMRRLRRPVLPDLRMAPAGRPGL